MNGRCIARGPCRGVMEQYHYETVDIAAEIKPGKSNVLAVEVRWCGPELAPCAEVHQAGGLWAMLGDAQEAARFVTNTRWRVLRSTGHNLLAVAAKPHVYTDIDPTEDVDLQNVPPGWREPEFDDSQWSCATQVAPAMGRYSVGRMTAHAHELVGREIPLLPETDVNPRRVLCVEELAWAGESTRREIVADSIRRLPCDSRFWGDNATPLELPAGTHAVTIDMGEMSTAFVRLVIEAPAGTMVELRYSEALWIDGRKGRRDDPSGKVEGYYDIFTCRGGVNEIEPFAWRAFRFLKISIHHPAGPVVLRNLRIRQTNYPFQRFAEFESSDPLHKTLADISWRTALCCAHEHYEDCPYYEQLQYVGDTRLQSLISYIVTGDFRLARQALRQFALSRRSDGITLSRTPSRPEKPQIIPNFSLIWIEFLEDFWMHSGDRQIVRELWSAVESILAWFDRFDRDGLLVDTPYWIFTDWTFPTDGRHVAGSEGELNMRRFAAVKAAARLAGAIGRADLVDRYRKSASAIQLAIRNRLWNASRGLLADTLDGAVIGEHASILAVLHDLVDRKTSLEIVGRLEQADDLAKTTIYYSYYTFRAYEKLGMWNRAYLSRKHLWENQLALGASTWFESPEPSRSDCHAWGSWVLCDLFTSILGITPASAGYESVVITPQFAGLDWAKGSMPTVRGTIAVAWERQRGGYSCTIALPPDTQGDLVAPDGRRFAIAAGEQVVWVGD